jgi:hypothetical protein
MKIRLTLDGPEEVVAVDVDARDRRAFERAGATAVGLKRSGSDFLTDVRSQMPETYSIWLAWHALAKRGGRTDLGTFDEFDARVADMDTDDAATPSDLGDPTQPAPSAG